MINIHYFVDFILSDIVGRHREGIGLGDLGREYGELSDKVFEKLHLSPDIGTINGYGATFEEKVKHLFIYEGGLYHITKYGISSHDRFLSENQDLLKIFKPFNTPSIKIGEN